MPGAPVTVGPCTQVLRYLADDVNLVADSGRRLFRSAYDRTSAVRRTYTGFGDRSFSVTVRPRVWNALTPSLRLDIRSYGQFKRQLKTFLLRS